MMCHIFCTVSLARLIWLLCCLCKAYLMFSVLVQNVPIYFYSDWCLYIYIYLQHWHDNHFVCRYGYFTWQNNCCIDVILGHSKLNRFHFPQVLDVHIDLESMSLIPISQYAEAASGSKALDYLGERQRLKNKDSRKNLFLLFQFF